MTASEFNNPAWDGTAPEILAMISSTETGADEAATLAMLNAALGAALAIAAEISATNLGAADTAALSISSACSGRSVEASPTIVALKDGYFSDTLPITEERAAGFCDETVLMTATAISGCSESLALAMTDRARSAISSVGRPLN